MLIQYTATYVHKGLIIEADAVGARARTQRRFMSASNSRRPTATSLTVAFGVSAAVLPAPASRRSA